MIKTHYLSKRRTKEKGKANMAAKRGFLILRNLFVLVIMLLVIASSILWSKNDESISYLGNKVNELNSALSNTSKAGYVNRVFITSGRDVLSTRSDDYMLLEVHVLTSENQDLGNVGTVTFSQTSDDSGRVEISYDSKLKKYRITGKSIGTVKVKATVEYDGLTLNSNEYEIKIQEQYDHMYRNATLFKYDAKALFEAGGEVTNKNRQGIYFSEGGTSINYGKYFWNQFSASNWNRWTGNVTGLNGNLAYTGIAKDELDENGNIQFNYEDNGIFDETVTAGKETYTGIGIPFIIQENEFYKFDSSEIEAHLKDGNPQSNVNLEWSENKVTYEGNNGDTSGFYPFNTGKSGEEAVYHFGMKTAVPFYLSKDGKSATGEDIIFDFFGDDDIWIYIDGKLVIDLGGIHNSIAAEINFAEGNVTIYEGLKETGDVLDETSLDSILGEGWDSDVEKQHTLSVFYLERGKGDSNCQVYLNLPSKVQKSDVLVHHYLEGTNTKVAEDTLIEGELGIPYQATPSDEIANNLELVEMPSNASGVIGSERTEVIFYYKYKDPTIENNVSKTSSVEAIFSSIEPVPYNISGTINLADYIGSSEIKIVDKLEYEIDENRSTLDGGIYNKNDKTITWTITNDVNTYENTNNEITYSKNISLVYVNVAETNRTIENNVQAEVKLSTPEKTSVASSECNVKIPETIDVSIEKIWDDNNDQDGKRPDEVQIQLYADGEKIRTPVTLNIDNANENNQNVWEYTFEKLYKYDGDNEIKYTVKEVSIPDGYEASYSDNGLTITNIHTPEKINKTVTKIWDDNSNQDGKRPNEVQIQLYADGEEINSPVEITKENVKADNQNEWEYTFTNLPKYEDGKEINYTVSEITSIEGYSTSYSDDTFTITNTHTPEKVDKQVIKIWNDSNNQDGKRPDSVVIQLYNGDKKVRDEVTLTNANVSENMPNRWNYTFEDLPKYENGKEINYTVKENKVDNYTVEYNGLLITNTHKPEKINKTVTKIWDDNSNQDGKRPEEIKIALYANDVQVGQKVTLTKDNKKGDDLNTWEYTFNDLAKYENGQEINYSVKEDKIESYETTYDGLIITNTHELETTSKTITKIWDDNNNQDGFRPDEIKIELLANGNPVKEKVTLTKENAKENDLNTWEYTFNDLYVYENGQEIEYTVREDKVDKYKTTYEGLTIKNKHEPELVNKQITKIWNDNNNQDGKRPDNIEIELLANGLSVVGQVTITKDDVELTDRNTWKYTFNNLPKYSAGEEIKYTVKESKVEYYETSYSEDGLIITNTHTPERINKTVTKVWDDNSNQDGYRPGTISVQLYSGEKEYGEVVEISNLNATKDDPNKWEYTFKQLPKYENGVEINYTVVEITNIKEYTKEYSPDTFTITNTHEIELIDKTITKVWDDNNNQDGKRPEEIEITLYENETPKEDKIKLTKENATQEDSNVWKYTIEDLPKYKNGEVIDYSVVEKEVDNYSTAYGKDKLTITNKHIPEKTNKTVTKVWVDNDNQDGKRPESTRLNLLVNGTISKKITLTEESNWTYEWNNLDVYTQGVRNVYTVEEALVPEGYEVSYNQDTLTVTNTHEVELIDKTITKVWDDNNNQDGKRPEKIEITIYENETPKEDKITLTKENAKQDDSNTWEYTIKDLPKYKEGKEIKYTIKENEIPEYETTYDQDKFIITNTHEIELIDKTITKVWDDNNNQDGKRPEEIEITIYENETPKEDKITLTKENTTKEDKNVWKYEVKDLPRYKNGQEIKYTVKEKEIEGYMTVYDNENFKITNTHLPEKTSKTIKKIWRDGDNIEKNRPESAELQLYANGEPIRDSVVLTKENQTDDFNTWEYTFDDLYVYENGKEIDYTVKEVSVPDGYGTIYDQNDLIVYNAFPPEVNVVVQKVWDDNNNGDKLRPESVDVQLLADGEKYIVGGNNLGFVTLSEENNWTHTYEFLQKYRIKDATDNDIERYVYTIEELDQIEYYETSYKTEFNEETNEYKFIITNKYNPKTVERSFENEWIDNDDQDGKRPDELVIKILANDKEVREVKLTKENGWKLDLDDLWMNEDGKEIEYAIDVVNPEGYVSNVKYDEDTKTFKITSLHVPEKFDLDVNKIWDDNNNQDGFRTDEITVNLLIDNEKQEKIVLNEENGWTGSFENLNRYKDGELINYSVKEEKVEKYDDTYQRQDDAITITNKHSPETKDISISKIWNDNNDQDGLRPDFVTVQLLKNGEIFDEVTLTYDNEWSYTWEDLNVYENTEKVTYEIKEINEIPEYTIEYEEDENGNVVITNTHIPYTTERTVSKIWNDNNNQDGLRPENIKVQLYVDGEKYGKEITLDDNSNWSYTWENLPERKTTTTSKEDGTIEKNVHVIVYTVEELTNVEGYDKYYNSDSFVITNKHEIEKTTRKVTVTWDDLKNNNLTRPNEIKVKLLADGVEKETITLNKQNNWTYEWDELDKFNSGKEIKYTIEEISSIPNYTTTYSDDTFTILNTLNKYNYKIEYYYDGIIDEEETVSGNDYYGNRISGYEDKIRDGYKFEKDENTELIITEDESKNIMRVYYVKDEFEYKIEYYYDGVLDKEKSIIDKALFGTVIDNYENKILDGYELKEVTNLPLTVSSDTNNNVIRVYYEKAKFEYTIKYFYDGVEDEDERITDEAIYQTVIDKYEDKVRNGYKLDKEENVPLTISSNKDNNIINIYYVKDEFEYRIEYYYDGVIDAEKTVKGKALYQSKIENYDEKLEYGYKKDKVENMPLTISYDTSKNIVKVYYVKKDAKVVIRHIDKYTNKVLDTVTLEGKVGDKFEAEAQNFEGYILVEPEELVSGTMTEETINIDYYYSKVSEGVLEKHVDIISGEVLFTKTHEGNEGTKYKIDPKEFEGYELVKDKLPEKVEGEMTVDLIEVTYYYIRNITMNVLYIDDVTGETIAKGEYKGLEGESYTIDRKSFEGYKLIEEKSPESDSGKFSRDTTEVKYFHVRKTKLTVNRIDSKTGTILETVTKDGIENEYYETEAKEIENYIIDDDRLPENAKGQLKVVKNDDGSVKTETVVNYYYFRKAGGVIIQYIDKETGEILEQEVKNGIVDDKYKTEEKDILGYTIIERPSNPEGLMTIDTIYVKYYYKKNSNVEVQYIDDVTGKQIKEKEILSGLEGTNYDASKKEFEGYKWLRTQGNEIGTFEKDLITVRHYYKKTTKVVVKYLDMDTREEILDTIEIAGLENDPYSTEAKEIPFYVMQGLPDNQSGTMKVNKVGDITEVTYYYKKLKFDLRVESSIKDIKLNGKSKHAEDDLSKLEIDRDLSDNKVKITYEIKVSNVGELAGTIGSLIDIIPNGLTFDPKDNDESWILQENKLTNSDFEDLELQPGEEKVIELVLTWDGNGNHLGELDNVVKIGSYSNEADFKDVNPNDNKDKSTILMFVRTGIEKVDNILLVLLLIVLAKLEFRLQRKVAFARSRTFGKIDRKAIRKYLSKHKIL